MKMKNIINLNLLSEKWKIFVIITTGPALQFAGGKTDTEILCYPANLSAGILFLFFLIAFHAASRKYPVLKWFSSVEAGVTSTASLLVLVIVMGLVRQVSPSVALVSNHIFDKTGFAQMTSSWSFALLFCYFLVVLGLTTIRKISRFRREGWVSCDDDRILGSLDWNVSGRFHDALKPGFENPENKLHLILAFNQNDEKTIGGTYYAPGGQPYKSMQTVWYQFSGYQIPANVWHKLVVQTD